MRLAIIASLLLAFPAVSACGECRGLASGPSAANGDIVYTTQEGTTLRAGRADLWSHSATSVDVRARIGDRPIQILIDGLVEGKTRTLAHDDGGKACLPVQGGAAPTCLLLDGTVDVKSFHVHDCTGNENITTCAEELDLTIHATSKDLGLSLGIELHVVSIQSTGACAD